MKRYEVLEEEHLKVLIDKVNRLIQNGWQPQGGVAWQAGNNWYLQAMTFDEP
ncbi:MAG: DUF1737 domain-containing protein [Aquabacterium sp.]|nr:DUF1737 domain-containing protein [Aquabacterium sp.]